MKPPPMPEPAKRPLPAVDYDASLKQNEKDHLKTFQGELLVHARSGQYAGFAPDGMYCWEGAGPPDGRVITLIKVEPKGSRPVFGEQAATLLAFDPSAFSFFLEKRFNEPKPKKEPT